MREKSTNKFKLGDVVRLLPDVSWIDEVRGLIGDRPMIVNSKASIPSYVTLRYLDTGMVSMPPSSSMAWEFHVDNLCLDVFLTEVSRERKN